ncbi:PAS domain-containing protein [Sulfurimonas sp. CS5]|uniref:PAS domain-containing protein n=1 Tax=Sulfurimonas sp. CS5 TaxID=3391145 RepID=UPI0039ED86A6
MSVTKSESSDEWFFSSDQYILSETDDKGLIVYANDLFCEMAAYKIEELIGQPHNIVRHPDMPRIAFKSLWDDIKSKGFWTGIVKNLRKDGGYYWVHATALRKIHNDGQVTYLSVRRVPSKREIETCIPLYAELKSSEQ